MHNGTVYTGQGKHCPEGINEGLHYFARLWLGICWHGLQLRQAGSVGAKKPQGKQLC